ncbi:MAG: phage tail protein [Spirosomataceae bacterium]
MNPTGPLLYPIPGFHFAVYFDKLFPAGLLDTRFQEVVGLSAELTLEEINEGGENRFVHKLPGRTKFPNLTLKRAMQVYSKLSNWATDSIYNLNIQRSNVQVILLNELHIPLAMWNFHNAYAVKIQISDFKAQESAPVIETLELAYQWSEKVGLDSVVKAVF